MNTSLLFIDALLVPEDDAYTGVELNLAIRPWQHSFPSIMFTPGDRIGINVDYALAGKHAAFRTGPAGTRVVIDGKLHTFKTEEDRLRRRIENRCEVVLRPTLNIGELPIVLNQAEGKLMPCFARNVTLRFEDLATACVPYMTLIQAQDQDECDKFLRFCEERTHMSLPGVWPYPVDDVAKLTRLLQAGSLTLPIALRKDRLPTLAAAKIHSFLNSRECDTVIYSSDNDIVMDKGTELFFPIAPMVNGKHVFASIGATVVK